MKSGEGGTCTRVGRRKDLGDTVGKKKKKIYRESYLGRGAMEGEVLGRRRGERRGRSGPMMSWRWEEGRRSEGE